MFKTYAEAHEDAVKTLGNKPQEGIDFEVCVDEDTGEYYWYDLRDMDDDGDTWDSERLENEEFESGYWGG